MSMFEDVTRALIKQLNPGGDLTPLTSLIDFKRFHLFCLLLRKRKSTVFWGARYVRTDYTLLDVLEPGSSPSDPTLLANFSFRNMLDARVEGDVEVPKTVKVKGAAGMSQSSTLEVQTLIVDPTTLENLNKERKLSADHPFLKEMREYKQNLYVVMEVVEAKQEVTLERTSNANAIFSLPSFAPLGLQGSMNHKEAVTIPKGCVLAYRVRQLMVYGEDEWGIPHIYTDNKPTFIPLCVPQRQGLTVWKLSGEMHEDFKTLKEEVQRETQAVEKLSPVGRSSLLTSLSHLLGKKEELQDLEQTLEGALDKGQEVTLETLPKDVLLSKEAMDAILYFLGALTELSEEQLKILVKSLEKKILAVQLKLVESILEKNFLQDKEGVFPLQPDLLSSVREEELILTEALVGLSGLEVQRSGPQYTWDPATRPHLCALYAGVSLLHLLSKDS
ncbi:gasdermin-A2-like isoform X1 [Mus pahari]|uniref:gasdermin-A2-like isoform X1 n=1 Tax=Mus pahari TaxID=10093 RepID=UPI000A3138E6|nr:gasdermin-A2-like isoform X1 [Mus pahari]